MSVLRSDFLLRGFIHSQLYFYNYKKSSHYQWRFLNGVLVRIFLLFRFVISIINLTVNFQFRHYYSFTFLDFYIQLPLLIRFIPSIRIVLLLWLNTITNVFDVSFVFINVFTIHLFYVKSCYETGFLPTEKKRNEMRLTVPHDWGLHRDGRPKVGTPEPSSDPSPFFFLRPQKRKGKRGLDQKYQGRGWVSWVTNVTRDRRCSTGAEKETGVTRRE